MGMKKGSTVSLAGLIPTDYYYKYSDNKKYVYYCFYESAIGLKGTLTINLRAHKDDKRTIDMINGKVPFTIKKSSSL